MNQYVTSAVVRKLREQKNMTQAELAAVSDNGVQLVKLYPEGNAEARFKRSRTKYLYACCNRHGLFRVKI